MVQHDNPGGIILTSFFRSIAIGAVLAMLSATGLHAQQSSNDGRNRNVTIYNNSDKDVYHVYFGRPDMEYYDRDLLGSQILDAGENIRVNIDNGRGDCTFKVKATTAGDADVWEKTFNVCTESSWTLVNADDGNSSGDGHNRNLTVYNNSSQDVYHVYFGRPGMEYYDRDLLGSHILNPGENIRVNVDNGRSDCTFNLKATTAGDSSVWEKQLNVCTESSWTLIDAKGGGSSGGHAITIINNSDYQVYKLQYGLPGREKYDTDLLGSNVIAPHASLQITVDNGRGDCTFEFKAQTQSAATVWERTLNVCSETSWTLTN